MTAVILNVCKTSIHISSAAPALRSEREETLLLLKRQRGCSYGSKTWLKIQFNQYEVTVLLVNEHLLAANFVLFYLSLKKSSSG